MCPTRWRAFNIMDRYNKGVFRTERWGNSCLVLLEFHYQVFLFHNIFCLHCQVLLFETEPVRVICSCLFKLFTSSIASTRKRTVRYSHIYLNPPIRPKCLCPLSLSSSPSPKLFAASLSVGPVWFDFGPSHSSHTWSFSAVAVGNTKLQWWLLWQQHTMPQLWLPLWDLD